MCGIKIRRIHGKQIFAAVEMDSRPFGFQRWNITGEIRLPILSRREARVRYQAKFRKNTNCSSVQLLSYCYTEEFSPPLNVDFNLKLFNPFISNADSIVAAYTQRIVDTNTAYSQWLVYD